MFSLTRPDEERIRRFLNAQAALAFSYAAVGATAASPPPGFVVDHTRVELGEGRAVFEAAKAGLQRWEQFRLGWVEVCGRSTPIRKGQVIGVLARVLGVFWSLNACRIVYTIDESGPIARFGFAYGTLPDHAGAGEERFLIEWDQQTGVVVYDILAFSRPNQWLSRLGYLYLRRKQKQFAIDSVSAVRSGLGT